MSQATVSPWVEALSSLNFVNFCLILLLVILWRYKVSSGMKSLFLHARNILKFSSVAIILFISCLNARSKQGLQNALDKLDSYCTKWNIGRYARVRICHKFYATRLSRADSRMSYIGQ